MSGLTHRKCVGQILDKEDALELDEEEVHELLHVLQKALDGISGNSVVLARPGGACDTAGEESSAGDFKDCGD
jgi:hypothetical protein